MLVRVREPYASAGWCSSGSGAREVLVKICELLGFAPFSLDAQQPLACRASSKRPGRRCSPKRPIATATLLNPNNSHILTRTPNILARRGQKAAAPLHPSPTRPRHRVHSPVVSLRLPRTCRSSPWGPRTFTGRFLGALAHLPIVSLGLSRVHWLPSFRSRALDAPAFCGQIALAREKAPDERCRRGFAIFPCSEKSRYTIFLPRQAASSRSSATSSRNWAGVSCWGPSDRATGGFKAHEI